MTDILVVILGIVLFIWEKFSVLLEKPEFWIFLFAIYGLHKLQRITDNIHNMQKIIKTLEKEISDIQQTLENDTKYMQERIEQIQDNIMCTLENLQLSVDDLQK